MYLRNWVTLGAILTGLVAALVEPSLLDILGVGIGMSPASSADMGDNPGAGGPSITAGIL